MTTKKAEFPISLSILLVIICIPLTILLLLISCYAAQSINAQIEVTPGMGNNLDNGNQNNQTQSGSNNSTNQSQANLVIPSSWRSTYRDSIGDLHIVGQVQNNFTFPIEFVQITGTVYDSSHQLVSTSDTYTNVDQLGPGEKSVLTYFLLMFRRMQAITQISFLTSKHQLQNQA